MSNTGTIPASRVAKLYPGGVQCLGVAESTIWRWGNEQSPIKPYALAAMSAWLHIFLRTGERPPEMDSEG